MFWNTPPQGRGLPRGGVSREAGTTSSRSRRKLHPAAAASRIAVSDRSNSRARARIDDEAILGRADDGPPLICGPAAGDGEDARPEQNVNLGTSCLLPITIAAWDPEPRGESSQHGHPVGSALRVGTWDRTASKAQPLPSSADARLSYNDKADLAPIKMR